MELSQTSVAGRKVAGPASRVKVFSCEGAGPDSRSEVARGEPRLGGSSVCSTQEAYMQRPDRNPARELSQTPVAGRKAAGPASQVEVFGSEALVQSVGPSLDVRIFLRLSSALLYI